jgi:hypothetical protein
MSGSGAGRVRSPSLEPGLGPDMFGPRLSRWGIRLGQTCSGWGPDMFGPGLSRWGIRIGQTCSGWGPDMSDMGAGHVNMILTWVALPWASNKGSSHYMIKILLLIHVTSSLWFNRDWHLELCDSLWLIWYLGFKHPLALLHHIRYLDAKTPACSSLRYGSS